MKLLAICVLLSHIRVSLSIFLHYYNIILVLKMFTLTKFTNRACVESVKRSKTVICTSKYYGEFHINLLALWTALGLDSRPRPNYILSVCYRYNTFL